MEQPVDIVIVPMAHLPKNIVSRILLSKDAKAKSRKPVRQWEFFTFDLDKEYYEYYIDKYGRLVFKEVTMSLESIVNIMTDAPIRTDLVFNIDHQWIEEPELETIYSVIDGKNCILAVSFEGGVLKQVVQI